MNKRKPKKIDKDRFVLLKCWDVYQFDLKEYNDKVEKGEIDMFEKYIEAIEYDNNMMICEDEIDKLSDIFAKHHKVYIDKFDKETGSSQWI